MNLRYDYTVEGDSAKAKAIHEWADDGVPIHGGVAKKNPIQIRHLRGQSFSVLRPNA